MNFSWRTECNRCHCPRADLTGGMPSSGGPPSDFGGKVALAGSAKQKNDDIIFILLLLLALLVWLHPWGLIGILLWMVYHLV